MVSWNPSPLLTYNILNITVKNQKFEIEFVAKKTCKYLWDIFEITAIGKLINYLMSLIL